MKAIIRVDSKMGDVMCYNKHMQDRKVRTGFTLIELSLSIVFIAILSVAVAIIVANAISSYHRGVILNQINTTGMEIVDDIRASIQNSSARSVKNECGNVYDENGTDATAFKKCEEDRGRNFVVVTRNANVTMGNKVLSNVPIYGALCTGNYSYVWNSGYFFSEDVKKIDGAEKVKLKYKMGGATNATEYPEDIKLVKIHDENRDVCITASGNNYTDGAGSAGGSVNVFDMTNSESGGIVDEEPISLIGDSSGLALYDLSTAVPASSKSIDSMFYTVSFILGTMSGGINVVSSGDFCTPPGDTESGVENFNYCAINKFNFAAEASGGK